jgi:WD40 repeat protein
VLWAEDFPTVVSTEKYQLTESFPSFPASIFWRDAVTAVAWSPDGKKLAAFSGYGSHIHVWNIATGDVRILERQKGSPYINNSLEFLDDDELLTPIDRGTQENSLYDFSVLNIQNGSIVKNVHGPKPDHNGVNAYALSPDRTMAVSINSASGMLKIGTREFGSNPVPLYSTATWQIIRSFEVPGPMAVAFSPDGKQIAFGGFGGVIRIYNIADESLSKTIDAFGGRAESIESLTYSADGRYIAESGYFFDGNDDVKSPRVVRVSDGEVIASYPGHVPASKVVWSPNGKILAFATHDKTVRLWNPNYLDNARVTILHINSMCLAFSPDGNQLASCDSDGVKVFNLKF